MGTSFQDKPEVIEESVESLRKVLFGDDLEYKIESSKYNREGKISGQLIGGNIAILASMLGSQSQITTEGKILFIEEIGEYKYSIDRMLQSLKRAGYFTKLKGIIVGDMSKVKKNTTPWGHSIEHLILQVVPKDIPIMFNFPAGHEPDNRALTMGREVSLKIGKETSSVIFK
jgi:muramoyltetrapeptide carboxypeptidase